MSSALVDLSIQLSAILSWLAMVLGLGAVVKRQFSNPELARKVVHIGTGNVLLIAWIFHSSLYLCLGVAMAFTVVAWLSYYTDILPMLTGIDRQTRGVFYYALSITLLVAVFWQTRPELTVMGSMVMAWGDGMAALIGQRWGKHKYQIGNNQRSWEGSLAMLLITYVLVGSILHWVGYEQGWLMAVPVALVSAVLEAISLGGTDNCTVPIASAGLCWLMTTL